MSWWFLLGLGMAGTAGSIFWFGSGRCLSWKRGRRLKPFLGARFFCFKPHANTLRHEGYKIGIAGRGLLLLLFFAALTGIRDWNRVYTPSAGELYYQDLMGQLEGEQTQEKENLLLGEEARFQEAFDKIAEIDRKVAHGEIKGTEGENLKAKWYAVTAFYPSFSRAWQQYQKIRTQGGRFLYDTGYLCLFGAIGEEREQLLTDLLLLSLCTVLAFGNVAAVEERNASWNLLSAIRYGKRMVIRNKIIVCMIGSALLSLVPFFSRAGGIARVFPMRGLPFSVGNIPYCSKLPFRMPVWCFLLLLALAQALALALTALAAVCISLWQKEGARSCFVGLLFLVMTLVLAVLGFSFAERVSLYPLYAWTAAL